MIDFDSSGGLLGVVGLGWNGQMRVVDGCNREGSSF